MKIEARKEVWGLGIPLSRYKEYAPGQEISTGTVADWSGPGLPSPLPYSQTTRAAEDGGLDFIFTLGSDMKTDHTSPEQMIELANRGIQRIPGKTIFTRFRARVKP